MASIRNLRKRVTRTRHVFHKALKAYNRALVLYVAKRTGAGLQPLPPKFGRQ